MAAAKATAAPKPPTKAAILLALHEKLGRCQEMIEDQAGMHECKNWAVSTVEERGYCGVHVTSIALAASKARYKAAHKAKMNADADAAIARYREHPSVWS